MTTQHYLNPTVMIRKPGNAWSGTYTFNFEDESTLDATISYFWQDISYSSIFNRWGTKIPAWDQTDGRLSWTSGDGKITLIGFIRNLFDEDVYDSRGSGRRQGDQRDVVPGVCGSTPANTVSHAVNPLGTLAQDCLTTTSTFRPPRTWGAELQLHF